MAKEKKVVCPWCEKESTPTVSKGKSDYGDMVVRKCSLCEKIIATYLDEEEKVLEKVRTFQN
jgi:hypothetical protein